MSDIVSRQGQHLRTFLLVLRLPNLAVWLALTAAAFTVLTSASLRLLLPSMLSVAAAAADAASCVVKVASFLIFAFFLVSSFWLLMLLCFLLLLFSGCLEASSLCDSLPTFFSLART